MQQMLGFWRRKHQKLIRSGYRGIHQEDFWFSFGWSLQGKALLFSVRLHFSILLLFCWCLSKRWRNMLNFILYRLVYLCSLCSIRLNRTIRSWFLVSSFRLGLSSRLRWWLCVWQCLRRKDQQIRDWRYNLWRSSPRGWRLVCGHEFWGCHPTYRAWQRFDHIPSWCFILGRRGTLLFCRYRWARLFFFWSRGPCWCCWQSCIDFQGWTFILRLLIFFECRWGIVILWDWGLIFWCSFIDFWLWGGCWRRLKSFSWNWRPICFWLVLVLLQGQGTRNKKDVFEDTRTGRFLSGWWRQLNWKEIPFVCWCCHYWQWDP